MASGQQEAIICSEFKAHSLRPDKCRDCLRDQSQHVANQETNESGHGNMSSNLSPNNDRDSAGEKKKDFNSSTSNHDDHKSDNDNVTGKCSTCGDKQAQIDQLQKELRDWKQRCSEALESREEYGEELTSLRNEMEEMKDSFREDESVQFEMLKKEYEVEAKKSKILQFRLNKCERQCSQLEQSNLSLERQLEELRQQQQEISIRNKNNNQHQYQQQQQQSTFVQLGPDFIKVSTREYDQLLRDLNDTSERERDLQEQVRFAQEEAQCKGDRLQAVEAENEVLLGRVSKLTLANSRLKSNLLSGSKFASGDHSAAGKIQSDDNDLAKVMNPRDLYEQNEQFRLALEMAQAECTRLSSKVQENAKIIEAKEGAIRKMESQLRQLEPGSSSTTTNPSTGVGGIIGQQSRLELECRQLRARLVHSERECRQLKAQIELLISPGGSNANASSRVIAQVANSSRSQHMETNTASGGCCKCGAPCNEINRQLEDQCQLIRVQKQELQKRVDQLIEKSGSGAQSADSASSMEADLLDKLKKQLDSSEGELAKARSRLVELDLRCNQAQRQYKDLLSSLESYNSDQQVVALQRMRSRAIRDGQCDSMSRSELRQAIKELDHNLEEVIAVVKVKNSLIDELKHRLEVLENDPNFGGENQLNQQSNSAGCTPPVEEQLKSVRRQLDQEKLTTSNLKIDVANLEEANQQMKAQVSVSERKCSVMSEELDRLRAVSGETRAELDEARRLEQCAVSRSRDLESTINDMRRELSEARRLCAQVDGNKNRSDSNKSPDNTRHQNEILLMSRDLSELKVKNGFLMRQLEIAREDTAKQLQELKSNAEAQQKQAVEMARLEVREKNLANVQTLRDEIADLKQKLNSAQRQVTKQEEDTNAEREKVRSMERDWRRDKSQWQQRYEQLEAQLTIERRTSEFRAKEAESMARDKERALINVQDRCVQLERDLKRLQNKYSLLEENSDSRIKSMGRELDMKTRELVELNAIRQQVDERHFVECRRLQAEKSTLTETLDSLRLSYDERSAELKSVRDLLIVRQEQAYRERASAQERIETLSDKLDEMSEHETQCKLLRQRLEALEKHLESARDDRSRLKARCDELERKCVQYEKRELIGKTSSIISGASSSLLRFGASAGSKQRSSSQQVGSSVQSNSNCDSSYKKQHRNQNDSTGDTSVVERLSGKINDQRHLINMLRQQLNETQLELKQMKLLQSSERSKWQTKCTLLTSRLNECEERLSFETGLLIGGKSPPASALSKDLLDKVVRPKLEQHWSKERQANLGLIQQQQAQIEVLAQDLKKISQAHDFLRLHSKQLESHNNKLSKKLIEYQQHFEQQQQQQRSMLAGYSQVSNSKLTNRQVAELEARNEQLKRTNDRLREHARPLVKIMSKVVSSFDSPPASVPAPTTTGASDSSRMSSSEASSMSRPLRAGDAMTMAASAKTFADKVESHNKAAQSAPAPQKSRLARLLGGSPKTSSTVAYAAAIDTAKEGELGSSDSKKKRVVRIKSSTLGITPTEKRQLKEHLRELSAAMDLVGISETVSTTNAEQRHSNEQQSTTISSNNNNNNNNNKNQIKPTAADLYLRHVVGTPQHYQNPRPVQRCGGGSLTDYEESESSIGFGLPTITMDLVPGAESDSGLATGAAGSSIGNRKRRGLKSRLTNTLRNLSRSITAGLGSDSETEGSVSSQIEPWRTTISPSKRRGIKGLKQSIRQASVESEISIQSDTYGNKLTKDSSSPARASSALREIRV